MSLNEEDRRIIVELSTHQNRPYCVHQYYVKSGVFTEEEGAFYSQMETLREKSDYNCFFNIAETDIVSKIAPASSFIEKVKHYIAEQK